MKTAQQTNGSAAEQIARRHAPCLQCGKRQWAQLGQDRDGVDLQCRNCGRYGQVRGLYRSRIVSMARLPDIPGASHAVHERIQLQGQRVDLYIVVWNRRREFAVFGIEAEQQIPELYVRRPILTGPRAGYELCDLALSVLDPANVRIVAARIAPPNARLRRIKPRWHVQVARPGTSISLPKWSVWPAGNDALQRELEHSSAMNVSSDNITLGSEYAS